MENAKLLHILGTGEKGEKRDLTSSFSQNPGGSLQVVKCGPPSRGDPPFFFSFFIIFRSTVTKCSTEYSWEYNRNTDNITYRTSLTPVSPRPRFLQIVGMCSLSLERRNQRPGGRMEETGPLNVFLFLWCSLFGPSPFAMSRKDFFEIKLEVTLLVIANIYTFFFLLRRLLFSYALCSSLQLSFYTFNLISIFLGFFRTFITPLFFINIY